MRAAGNDRILLEDIGHRSFQSPAGYVDIHTMKVAKLDPLGGSLVRRMVLDLVKDDDGVRRTCAGERDDQQEKQQTKQAVIHLEFMRVVSASTGSVIGTGECMRRPAMGGGEEVTGGIEKARWVGNPSLQWNRRKVCRRKGRYTGREVRLAVPSCSNLKDYE